MTTIFVNLVFFLMIILGLSLIIFWLMLLRMSHPSPQKAEAYRTKRLSKIDHLKIDLHIDMCLECQNLFKQQSKINSRELPLEDHLIAEEK